MTPISHPDVLLLGQYAFGHLPAAPSMVIEAHLARCAQCRTAQQAHEVLGGAMLLDEPSGAIRPTRMAMMIEQITDLRPVEELGDLPPAPPRRWTFPNGVWVERLSTPAADGWRAFRIGAPPGAKLPEHRHAGAEYTCILEGEIVDAAIRYRAGDFSDADVDQLHRLQVVGASPGVALIATEQPLRWSGVMRPIGRLLGL